MTSWKDLMQFSHDESKVVLYDQLERTTNNIPAFDMKVILRDCNAHDGNNYNGIRLIENELWF